LRRGAVDEVHQVKRQHGIVDRSQVAQ
jgi:hypothetical protein